MNCFAWSHETRRFVNLMRSVDLRDVNATPLTEHEPTPGNARRTRLEHHGP